MSRPSRLAFSFWKSRTRPRRRSTSRLRRRPGPYQSALSWRPPIMARRKYIRRAGRVLETTELALGETRGDTHGRKVRRDYRKDPYDCQEDHVLLDKRQRNRDRNRDNDE